MSEIEIRTTGEVVEHGIVIGTFTPSRPYAIREYAREWVSEDEEVYGYPWEDACSCDDCPDCDDKQKEIEALTEERDLLRNQLSDMERKLSRKGLK